MVRDSEIVQHSPTKATKGIIDRQIETHLRTNQGNKSIDKRFIPNVSPCFNRDTTYRINYNSHPDDQNDEKFRISQCSPFSSTRESGINSQKAAKRGKEKAIKAKKQEPENQEK